MSVFKCKMCGGSLERLNDETVVTCNYCGTTQTLPRTSDDNIANLFNRANNLRLKCEFDKAAQIYEKIVEQDDSEAEAHWGIVLCKYGIEYVEDPKTNKRIPTCHRTLFEAIATDVDYQAAIDYSDIIQQEVYQAEAKAIDRIQKDILAVVKSEEPFDVFICYKETDATGKRTRDSVIANDIYHQLTTEGYKVFYAAITLEDKLGQEYEPYIFAALNSAKVMLVVGTQPEYFSAVWVRNEWSRFLQFMKSDRSKLLIPCYRDMDPYDLPDEFAYLQAQDMGKIGFINDLVRGIKKVTNRDEPNVSTANAENIQNTDSDPNISIYLKRAFISLENGDWKGADDYCEKVLQIDPGNTEAYLGKLMAERKVRTKEQLAASNQNVGGTAKAESPLVQVAHWLELDRVGDMCKKAADSVNKAVKSSCDKLVEDLGSISGVHKESSKDRENIRKTEESTSAKEAKKEIAEKKEPQVKEQVKKQTAEITDSAKAFADKEHKKCRTSVMLIFILGYVAVAFISILLPMCLGNNTSDSSVGIGMAIFILALPTLLTFISLTKPDKGGMILALISNLLCIPTALLLGLVVITGSADFQMSIEMIPTILLALHIAIISTWRRRIGKGILRITQKNKQ